MRNGIVTENEDMLINHHLMRCSCEIISYTDDTPFLVSGPREWDPWY